MPRQKGARSHARRSSSASGLAERVIAGDPAAVGRALTCVVDEAEGFEELGRAFFRFAGTSHKIGLSGPPGGGKSSLINRLVTHYRQNGERIGILAVDPTSPFTGGAFLGDRLRVQEHAADPEVFFRSLGSRGMTGGLSATIFGAIHVLEAFGCKRILIETIGTGQDEVEIGSVADSVVYVTAPSLGDEIQAMKAGAMEVADVFVVNKSDLEGSDKAVASLKSALAIGNDASNGGRSLWKARVLAASAASGQGIEELVRTLEEHRTYLTSHPEGSSRLKAQLKEELSLFVSRRLTRDTLGRITESHLEMLRTKETDPVTLGERLIGGKARRAP